MPKYMLYAVYTGTQPLGEGEAASKGEAEKMGWEHEDLGVSLCHQCSGEMDLDDGMCPARIIVETTEDEQ